MSSEEHDWIFDFVLQFLESDLFDAAIMNFVDDKCVSFDNEDENKFIYTEIHNEFREHIENVISSNLGELGVTPEIFYEACEFGRHTRDINRTVFDKIIAMDDFLTFKKIMVKRNMELELETIRSYRSIMGLDTFPNSEDFDNYEAALKSSLAKPLNPLPDPEELEEMGAQREEEVASSGPLTEEEMQSIIRNSFYEMELLQKQQEMEQLQLEQVLAMSLALEEERLRMLRLDGKLQEKGSSKGTDEESEWTSVLAGDADVNASAKGVASSSYYDDYKSNSKESDVFADVKAVADLSDATSPTATRAATHAAPAKDTGDSQSARDRKAYKSPSKPLLEVPEPKPLKLRGELRPLPDIKGTGGMLGPLSEAGGRGKLAPVSSAAIADMQDDLDERRRQANEAFQRNQDQLAAQRAQQDELRRKLSTSEADAEKRAKYMREQRDRLLAVKKAEREAKVKIEEERKAKAGFGEDLPRVLAAQAESAMVTRDEKNDDEEIAERRRAAMRTALARRMKQELIESGELQQAHAQEEQFAALDRQLRQVEVMRQENQQREKILSDQIRRQQALMARNVQRSAANLKHYDE